MVLYIAGLEDSLVATTLFFAVVVLGIVQRIVSNHLYNKKYKFPPRIPGLPIVGNTFQLPLSQQGPWGIVQAKKYGEIYVCLFFHYFNLLTVIRFTCKIGVNTWVFLNSSRVVNDLMEKRSGIYSSRANLPMTSNIMSGGCRVLLMQ